MLTFAYVRRWYLWYLLVPTDCTLVSVMSRDVTVVLLLTLRCLLVIVVAVVKVLTSFVVTVNVKVLLAIAVSGTECIFVLLSSCYREHRGLGVCKLLLLLFLLLLLLFLRHFTFFTYFAPILSSRGRIYIFLQICNIIQLFSVLNSIIKCL